MQRFSSFVFTSSQRPPCQVFGAPDDLAGVKLRLPYIAELIHQLKESDRLPFKRVPLTVGEARREILETFGRPGG